MFVSIVAINYNIFLGLCKALSKEELFVSSSETYSQPSAELSTLQKHDATLQCLSNCHQNFVGLPE